MKTLIIDDERSYGSGLARALNNIFDYHEDEKPDIKTNPENGIKAVNHTYELIFVDFNFINHKIDGADVGLEIRKKYPLAVMILITGFGEENIHNFIHVGFDAYINKDDEQVTLGFNTPYLKRTIDIGINNSQKRIKTRFTADELLNVKEKLDAIEKVLEAGAYHKAGDAVTYGNLYQEGVGLEELKSRSVDIEKLIKAKQGKYVSTDGNEYPLIKRTSLNKYLAFFHKESGNFIVNENALKVRFIILKEKEVVWKRMATSITTFKSFLKNFDIQ